MLDTDLLDEVGYGMYARRHDMFQVRQARDGRVACQHCAAEIQRRGPQLVDGR